MIEIPAITLWQPWASLLACGAKEYETRSWATLYRGPIAIHAAATPFKRIMKRVFPLYEWSYAPDYTAKRKFVDLISKYIDVDNLCYGAVVATAELVECRRIMSVEESPLVETGSRLGLFEIEKNYPAPYARPLSEQELVLGDWTPGRYAWEFTNMQLLPEPTAARGMQGLWKWRMPA